MLLVEGRAAQMAGLAAALPRWLVTEEHAFALGRGSIEGSDHASATSSRTTRFGHRVVDRLRSGPDAELAAQYEPRPSVARAHIE